MRVTSAARVSRSALWELAMADRALIEQGATSIPLDRNDPLAGDVPDGVDNVG